MRNLLQLELYRGDFPFRAMLWKEWRESRRQFLGCILVLIILPAILGFLYYRMTGYQDALFMPVIGLGALAAIPLAASWGAHVVCRDLLSVRAEFLLARPITSREPLFAKAIITVGLFVALVLIDIGAFFIFAWAVVEERDFVREIWSAVKATFIVLPGLVAVVGVSFASAVTIRRFLPSVLLGLLAGLICVFMPFVIAADYFRDESYWKAQTAYVLIASAAAFISFIIPLLLGWRMDRRPVSTRAIAWFTVALILSLIAVVSDTFTTNTRVESSLAGGAYLIGSTDSTSYWSDSSSDDGVRIYGIRRITIDSDGAPINARHVRFRDMSMCPDGFVLSTSDYMEFLACGLDMKKKCTYLAIYDVDFLSEDVHPRVSSILHDATISDWTLFRGKLFRVQVAGPGDIQLYCYVLDGAKVRQESVSQILHANECELKVINDQLRLLTTCWLQSYDNPIFQEFAVTQPSKDTISVTPASDIIEIENAPETRGQSRLQYCAMQDDRLAISTRYRLTIYQKDSKGHWKELGRRRANLLQMLAGPHYSRLNWQGDLLLETTVWMLTAYDTSNGTPRRIGQLANPTWQEAIIDSRRFLAAREQSLEVHRLPD